jgi:hypothetical protein
MQKFHNHETILIIGTASEIGPKITRVENVSPTVLNKATTKKPGAMANHGVAPL